MADSSSNLHANSDAIPPVMNDVGLQGGRVRVIQDQFEVATDDMTIGDVLRLCRIPVNARLLSVKIGNDDLDDDTDLIFDLGFYDPDDDTAVDSDCLVTDSTQLQAAAALTELRYETLGIETKNQRLWEMVSPAITADPGGDYDLAITFDDSGGGSAGDAVGGTAGTLAFEVLYVVD